MLCRVIRSLSEVTEDPRVKARHVISKTEHPTAGKVRTADSPWRFGLNGMPQEQRPAPVLGTDTREVLREVGYADNEMDELVEREAAYTSATKTS